MAVDRVEMVRSIYEGWAHGDFRAGTEHYDPLVLLVQGPGFPEAGAYLGLDGVAEYMRLFLGSWSRVTIAAEELVPLGDSVVAGVIQRGTGKGSGAETDFRYFHVWSFRGARVIRIENFRDREEALAAAGD